MKVINNHPKHYNQYPTLLTSWRARGPWPEALHGVKKGSAGSETCSEVNSQQWDEGTEDDP